MKKFLFLLVAVALLTSCGGEKTANDKLGKLNVTIPDELKDNKEVVEFIDNMVELSDEYAILLDETLEKTQEFNGKETEDLSMLEQMKLMKITGEVAIKSTSVMAKWGEALEHRTQLEEQLSDEEIEALESVYVHFEKRMEQIQEKYGEITNE